MQSAVILLCHYNSLSWQLSAAAIQRYLNSEELMLCPNCGCDVGDTLKLCFRCENEAAAQSSGGGRRAGLNYDHLSNSVTRRNVGRSRQPFRFSSFFALGLASAGGLLVCFLGHPSGFKISFFGISGYHSLSTPAVSVQAAMKEKKRPTVPHAKAKTSAVVANSKLLTAPKLLTGIAMNEKQRSQQVTAMNVPQMTEGGGAAVGPVYR
jgi:hypothetical protein